MRILGAALFIGSIILSWTVDPRLDAKHRRWPGCSSPSNLREEVNMTQARKRSVSPDVDQQVGRNIHLLRKL